MSFTGKGKFKKWGAEAQRLFLDGIPVEEISKLTGVSDTSIYKWAGKYGWYELLEKKTRSTLGFAERIQQRIMESFEELSKTGIINAAQADALHKLTLIMQLMGGVDDPVANALDALRRFAAYASARGMTPEQEAFLNDLIMDFLNDIKKSEYGE